MDKIEVEPWKLEVVDSTETNYGMIVEVPKGMKVKKRK